ncbi:Ribonuclease H domain [Sesbania bispinosa]|nr:Ribonuclease H domain [Sesbania bispinosa]
MFHYWASSPGNYFRVKISFGSLLKARDILLPGFKLKVGNGDAKFWFDNWTGDGPLCNKVWAIDIHDLEIRDQVVWSHNLSGLYSARNGYSWTFQFLYPQQTDEHWDWIWRLQDASYVRCGELEETCLHSFRDCKEVANFWRGLGCDDWHGFFLNSDVKEWVSIGFRTTYDSDAFILNTDESVIDGKAGFGGIIRFHDGTWRHGFYGSLDRADVIEVELVGIYQGLQLCRQLGIVIVRCQSDSKLAVHWVLEGVAPSHIYANLVELIRRLLSLPWDASIQHVLREGNGCADFLVKKGVQSADRIVFIQDPHVGLSPILQADATGELRLRL